jgi:hypothetical protein
MLYMCGRLWHSGAARLSKNGLDFSAGARELRRWNQGSGKREGGREGGREGEEGESEDSNGLLPSLYSRACCSCPG